MSASRNLSEVVVTALGIKKKKKRFQLRYAGGERRGVYQVQNIKPDSGFDGQCISDDQFTTNCFFDIPGLVFA